MAFEGQFIKGMTLKSRLSLIESRWGAEAVAKILEAMPEASGRLLKGRVISTNWYPFQVQVDLDETICKVLASGDEQVFIQLGVFAAEYQKITSAIKATSRNPWTFLQMEERIFSRYTRPGVMTVEMVDSKKAIMRITDWQSTRHACDVNRGFIIGGITIAGGKNVRVDDVACVEDPGVDTCIYRISWE